VRSHIQLLGRCVSFILGDVISAFLQGESFVVGIGICMVLIVEQEKVVR
jgi:hypothetical protein